MTRVRLAVGMSVLVLTFAIPARLAEAATLNVPSRYPTLQAAVNAAQNGDTIVIASSSTPYQIGSVTVYPSTSGPGTWQLLIQGQQGDPSQTVLEGTLQFHPVGVESTFTLTLQGLTIRKLSASSASTGVYATAHDNAGTTLVVANCVIEGHGIGLLADFYARPQIFHSVIRNNSRGVVLDHTNPIQVTRSVISNNGDVGIAMIAGCGSINVDHAVIALNGLAATSSIYGGIWVDACEGTSFIRAKDTTFYGNRPFHYSMRPSTVFTDQGGTVFLDGGNGQPTVICTELHRQGFISDAWFAADSAYANLYIDPATRAGYVRWATPLTKLMARSRGVTALVRPFGRAWAKHMAYVMGASQEDSALGRWLNTVGVPLNRALGQRLVRHQQ